MPNQSLYLRPRSRKASLPVLSQRNPALYNSGSYEGSTHSRRYSIGGLSSQNNQEISRPRRRSVQSIPTCRWFMDDQSDSDQRHMHGETSQRTSHKNGHAPDKKIAELDWIVLFRVILGVFLLGMSTVVLWRTYAM